MTRKIAPTSMVDECTFHADCPFDCPLPTCVKEYPGGVTSYQKDQELRRLIDSGMDMYEAAEKMGIGTRQAGTRYRHASKYQNNPAKPLSTH